MKIREIKFRFWTGTNMENWAHASTWDGLGYYLTGNSEYIPMQFTGAKDVNGKEIYEGDIVRYKYGQICQVYFDYASFRIKPFPNISITTHVECEVIGNIYENPELLNN